MEEIILKQNIEIQKLQQELQKKNTENDKFRQQLMQKDLEYTKKYREKDTEIDNLNSRLLQKYEEYTELDVQKDSKISELKKQLMEKEYEYTKAKSEVFKLKNRLTERELEYNRLKKEKDCKINELESKIKNKTQNIEDTNLNNLKIAKLREIIQIKNINIKSRKKEDLINAILNFDKTQTQTQIQGQIQTQIQTQTKDYTKLKLKELKKICEKNNIYVEKTREKSKYIEAIKEFEEDKIFEEKKKIEQSNQRKILESKINNIENQIKCSSCSKFFNLTTSKFKCSHCTRCLCTDCEDIYSYCKCCNMKFCAFCLDNDKCIRCNNFFDNKKENATVHYIDNIYEFPEDIPTKEYNNGDLIVDKLNFNTENDVTEGVYIIKNTKNIFELEYINFRDKIISSHFSLGPNKPPDFWSRCELEGSWPLWPLPEPISINYFKNIRKDDLVEIENKVFRFSLDWIDIYFESSSKENIIRYIGKAIYNNEKVLYFETLIDSKQTRPNNNYQSYFL